VRAGLQPIVTAVNPSPRKLALREFAHLSIKSMG